MMTDKASILIIEDEPSIAELIEYTMAGSGWSPIVASTAAEGWAAIQRQTPQLVLLDWMLPDQSGLRFLSRLRAERQFQSILVMMLTAKSMEEDKISGLDNGADDYMTKPFSPRELTSRVKALLRRKNPDQTIGIMSAGAVTLDPASCSVAMNEQKIDIGHAEYRLLKFFMANPDRVFSRSQLLDKVWGDHVVIEERTVDVHILRLRKALHEADNLIRTVRSVGYMLSTK
ncbi:winged helix-turn-helix domain-containing protein [Glaciimonas sp. PAMC28666]|uniref:winged helix-turn-helix domain-containing protein n=1 Tax=Glaciimonas sp. PAMC28666 TaxID=2807626 RepID=UPI0019628E9D|nr:winged helix-turn-helix domain-containing protein [Glaciimonas sp. PAMC28666]QRX82166.1 winged helix-turn-helix domain-containing protein [Glaciimonas sp. PAMC28666]